jgi:uncharacterized protein (TIGR02453 family)
VAAHFPARGFARGTGSGLYVHLGPREIWMGGGIYMPDAPSLRTIRDQIASSHPRLHRIVTARSFTGVFEDLGGERLTRVPRGYAKDHRAARYLVYKQFLAGRELEPGLATSPDFYPELLRTFRAAAPLVRFLNTALTTRPAPPLLVEGLAPRRTGRRTAAT